MSYITVYIRIVCASFNRLTVQKFNIYFKISKLHKEIITLFTDGFGNITLRKFKVHMTNDWKLCWSVCIWHSNKIQEKTAKMERLKY